MTLLNIFCKCIWECRLDNVGHFVSASMCNSFDPHFYTFVRGIPGHWWIPSQRASSIWNAFPCHKDTCHENALYITYHYSHVKWAPKQLNSPAFWLIFFSSLFKLTSKETSKLHIAGPLWGESTGDRLIPVTKGTVMRTVFLIHDFIIFTIVPDKQYREDWYFRWHRSFASRSLRDPWCWPSSRASSVVVGCRIRWNPLGRRCRHRRQRCTRHDDLAVGAACTANGPHLTYTRSVIAVRWRTRK